MCVAINSADPVMQIISGLWKWHLNEATAKFGFILIPPTKLVLLSNGAIFFGNDTQTKSL